MNNDMPIYKKTPPAPGTTGVIETITFYSDVRDVPTRVTFRMGEFHVSRATPTGGRVEPSVEGAIPAVGARIVVEQMGPIDALDNPTWLPIGSQNANAHERQQETVMEQRLILRALYLLPLLREQQAAFQPKKAEAGATP